MTWVYALLGAGLGFVAGLWAGRRMRGRKMRYAAANLAVAALVVPLGYLALRSGQPDIVGVPIGMAFGALTGLRHGFDMPFSAATPSPEARSDDPA